MDAFANVKQPPFFIGESLESSDANMRCIMCKKSTEFTVDLTEP